MIIIVSELYNSFQLNIIKLKQWQNPEATDLQDIQRIKRDPQYQLIRREA